ncbi:hypothetical protein SISNIDRAFT_140768 [Sistotremastrum niveocremeum HHB9708]|uniref:Mei2-like C-terminal RNA recognition motif domain-containing protein n=1 Tax=Sistotremastrum niveocremeum HHB9708 TaxID=1314777 RepID=A0A165A180_9AGAM|nr:hypothetical protein SISNIDRAFT_140768 [Sistotremastrum niveocremeum HHB9708]
MHSPLSPHAPPFSSPTPHTSPVYYNYPVHHEPPYGPLIDLGYPAAGLNPDAMAYSQPPWNWLPPNQLQSATSFLNTPALTNVIIPDNGAQDPVTQVSNLLTNYTPMREVGVAHPSATPLRNVLDFEKIEAGQDTRTTVMIKNIPNKMTDKDLLTYIHAICPRKIDFMYLRIDFNNHCNVGYAFVNFIEVSDLLLFAKTKLGTRWNMFSSEKVLQMSYANYQEGGSYREIQELLHHGRA